MESFLSVVGCFVSMVEVEEDCYFDIVRVDDDEENESFVGIDLQV